MHRLLIEKVDVVYFYKGKWWKLATVIVIIYGK